MDADVDTATVTTAQALERFEGRDSRAYTAYCILYTLRNLSRDLVKVYIAYLSY